ncbi:hypothetical protein DVT68_05820 [Dyella solisilvae]|uniref:Uncharacterized protein n=1 Tax=Dyella solisilvae TaxID=1920168 RepID=A0A370KCI9_9GAMM|nr:hypothetical protein [Dyella solisilvae]RDJ00320.1 hypothetical protein DVT68_05820 [Dyella solisilvae]
MLFHLLANGAAVAAVLGLANLTTIDCSLLRLPRRRERDATPDAGAHREPAPGVLKSTPC